MKKKKITALIALIFACVCLFAFTGCDFFLRSADSNFPYDGAVQEGYTGTEANWIASQSGTGSRERQLFEEAVRDGYRGSYVEFLKEIGTTVSDDSAAINYALTSVVSIESRYNGGRNVSAGSGVFYSIDKSRGDAYVITNYHVVCSTTYGLCKDINVYLYGGVYGTRAIRASFYGGATEYDIAVLKISGSSILKETESDPVYARAVTFGDSDGITVGERVYALGNPNGDGFSATGGIVSVDAEYINVARADNERESVQLLEIRIDASINHGNSGGGLFNSAGELVGIVNARSEEEGIVAFGYAIPVNLVKPLVENILDNYATAKGAAYSAKLGVTVTKKDGKGVYDEETGKYYIEEKLTVQSVNLGSAARAAGLEAGDTFLSVTLKHAAGGEKAVSITRDYHLSNLLLEVRYRDTLVIRISRGGEVKQVTVSFTERSYFSTVT